LASKSAELSLWDVRILTFCWTLCLQTIFLKCYGILPKDRWHLVDNNYVEQIPGINYDAHCSSVISVCMFRLAGMINWYPWSSFYLILFSIYFHYCTFVRYVFEVWCHCSLYTCHTCIVHNLQVCSWLILIQNVTYLSPVIHSLSPADRKLNSVKLVTTSWKRLNFFVSL
jgi:hypothetical protein